MSEETMTADQPQEEVQQPETATAETTAEEHLEPSAGEEAATEEGAVAEGETEEEASDDWLPTEQEKEFPLETLTKYAKRYGYKPEEIEADPRIQRFLKDKLNSDILIRQHEEPTLEDDAEAEEEPEAAKTTAADPKVARQEYQQAVKQLVESAVDPESVKQLGLDLLSGFGVDVANVKDPEIKALVDNASKVGGTLATAAVDLVNTVLPSIVGQALEQAFPGFGDMYQRSMFMTTWDQVRGSDEQFAKLPAYGTQEFKTTMKEAAKQIPGFDKMVFRGEDGRILPAHQQASEKYKILAKLASGQKVSPAVVAQAVETGKRLANDASKKRAAGKALGAGKSTQQSAPGGGDDWLAALHAHNESQFSTERKSK